MSNFKIIINNGSSSKKYALFSEGKEIIFSHYEKMLDGFAVSDVFEGKDERQDIGGDVFENSFAHFLDRLIKYNLISSEDDISSVVIRIVAPGKYFQEHKLVDKKYLEKLDEVTEFSPLHIKPVKQEISLVMDKLPGVEIVAISDSAFHSTMKDVAKVYSLPSEITEEFEIYRYGYHGISVSSIVNNLKEKNRLKENIIICHLGGGSSVTAVKNGESVDTSMGFSPLEGVPMASRIGTIDPNALLNLIDHKDYTTKEMQEFLYHKCGLLGLSGVSNDTRKVLEAIHEGNERADLALNLYTYEIKKLIGAYTVSLGGLNTIIFTGTIGIRSAEVRKRICEGLEVLGIRLDESKNKLQIKGGGRISEDDSLVEIYTMPTDETGEMSKIASHIS